MKITRKFVLAGALVVVVAAPAAALTIPPILPDICASWNGCDITFTNSAMLANIQQLYGQATQLANDARNLAGFPTLAHQAITRNVDGVTQGRNPQTVGDDSAGAVIQQTPADAANIAQIDSQAASADGAKQQAQVSSLYLSAIAGETAKANALAAEQQEQRKNARDYEASSLKDFFGSGTSTGGTL